MKKLVSWLLLIAMIVPMCAIVPVSASSSVKFELLSVKAINDYQIELKFSHSLATNIETLINTNQNARLGIAWVKNGHSGQESFDSVVTGQASGSVQVGDTADTLIWTLGSTTTTIGAMLKETKEGYTRKFYFYDYNCHYHGAGYIGGVQGVSSSGTTIALSIPDAYKKTADAGRWEYMFMDITPAPVFGIESVTAISDYMVAIKFNRDLRTDNGTNPTPWIVQQINENKNAYLGLALVSNIVTGREPIGDVTKSRIAGRVAMGATNDTLIWTADEAAITEANSISSLKAAAADGYSLKFYLQDGCHWHGVGKLGAIQGVKVGSVETALPVPAGYEQSTGVSFPGDREYMFVDINTEALENDLELVSVVPINEYTFEVTFNKAVSANSTNLGANLRLLNPNGSFYYTEQGKDFGYSVGSTIKPTEDPKVWTWTMPADYAAIGSTNLQEGRIPSANKSINYVLDTWKDKLDAGYKAALIFLDGKDANLGYSKRVQAVDGGYLRTPQLTNGFECVFKEVSAFTEDIREGITVESATIISDNQIMVKFSDEVTMDFAPWISLRIVNEKGNQIDNATWQKRYAHYVIGGDTIVFTFDADMMDMFNLEGKYADIEGAVGAVLSFEELGSDSFDVCYDGYIDNVTTVDGKRLKGTLRGTDGLSISEFTDARGELIRVESAIKVSDTQLEVTFSAPVEIPYNPYIALRVYDNAGNLQRFTHNGQDAVAQVPFTWYYSDDTKTKITLMYPDQYMNDLLDLTGQFAYLDNGTNKTYLTIEELPVKDVFECPGNGVIDNIVGATSKLAATTINTTGYEQVRIMVAEDTREELTLVSATLISGNEVVLKFSHPVSIDYAPFLGMRILDKNMKMVFDNGSPLQIYQGTWEYTTDAHDTIKWTSKDWILEDYVNLRGNWAKFKELGYTTYFCIEEMQDKEGKEIDTKGNGYIDNVVKADGKLLSATSRTFGEGYDGLYIAITEDFEEPEFYLKSVTAINTTQLALEFNKPVQIDELEPYMAIRYVDENNTLQYDGKTPLQYAGECKYGNEEKTVLIWTQKFGGNIEQVIKQTDSYKAYSKYDVKFCIEEIPADKKKGDVEDGTIHNVYTIDGTVRLYANKVASGTGWDGLYLPITVNFDYTVPGTVIASAIQANSNTNVEYADSPMVEPDDNDETVVPVATGPASDLVTMAIHTDSNSTLPWVALALAAAVFVGVIAVLFVLIPKKKR